MKTNPLPQVTVTPAVLSAAQVAAGRLIAPLDRLRIMSPAEWEDFTLEYAHSLKTRYDSVERHAGAGDMGCDVVARLDGNASGPWENHQCKHYKDALTPVDAIKEIGKCCYYASQGDITWPQAYYFVAPRGPGTKLSKLLKDAVKLKAALVTDWDKYCRTTITDTQEVLLDAALTAFIHSADFAVFKALSPLTVIEQHAKTPWHVARFGGGLQPRLPPVPPPAALATIETTYVRRLLDAYEERLGSALAGIADLKDINLTAHFQRARLEFYSAESLREFSRDNVPAGTFERLLDDVYSGVIDVVDKKHPDAMERVLACVAQAKALALASNALVTRINNDDKGGMCHQLANDQRLTWKK